MNNKNNNACEKKISQADFDKRKLLHFYRTASGEKILRLSDRRRGERLAAEFTFEEIKRAFDEA